MVSWCCRRPPVLDIPAAVWRLACDLGGEGDALQSRSDGTRKLTLTIFEGVEGTKRDTRGRPSGVETLIVWDGLEKRSRSGPGPGPGPGAGAGLGRVEVGGWSRQEAGACAGCSLQLQVAAVYSVPLLDLWGGGGQAWQGGQVAKLRGPAQSAK